MLSFRNKREFLARRLRDAGLLRLLERLAGPGLVVLCYHRIGDASAEPFYGPLVSATAEDFEAQMRAVRDRFRVVGLEEALAIVEGRATLRGPAVLVTFDDGYRDNVEVALPILLKLGVPAAFFLTVDFVAGAAVPWWDRVAFVVKNSPRGRLVLDRPGPLDVDLSGPDRHGAMMAVIVAFLRSDRPDDPAALAELEGRAGVDLTGAPVGDLFLGWDDARRLRDAGMGVGAHTMSHPKLARLAEPEQAAELRRSRERLEQELGRPVEALAYPYGTANDFNEVTRRRAAEAGYQAAFALESGLNRPGRIDPFVVRRLGIGGVDSPALVRARVALTAALGRSVL